MVVSSWTGRSIRRYRHHGQSLAFLLTEDECRFTKLVYLPEGKPIIDTVWDETMKEYEFAGAREILNKCKPKDNA
jgi:hypothetical protein